MPKMKLSLVGPWGQQVFVSDRPEVTIGRGQGNSIRIHDDKASRVHCRITRDHEGYFIRDAESSNGTYVNGVVTMARALKHGDAVRIGSTTIRVELEEPVPDEEDGSTTRIDAEITQRLGESTVVPALRARLAEVEKTAENLRSLVEINQSLLSELDRDKLWERIVDTAISLTRAERGFLLLLDGERMVVQVARNFRREEPDYEFSQSIARKVAGDGRPLITANAEADDRFDAMRSVAKLKLRSILCVPLRRGETSVGALYFDNRFEEGLFSDDDMYLLESFAAQASLALKNADLFAELEASRDKIVELNRALEGKVQTQQVELEDVRRVLRSQQDSMAFRYNYSSIVGRSAAMTQVLAQVDRITATNLPVLVGGESGTGKELIARAIHYNSPRSERPFISENCAAIPANLFESELFGYRRGAFTGAHEDRKGLIELADGGTLFLDEIGDLALAMQKKLLRVLQEGELRRLGDKEVRKVDVRVVSATNRDLESMIQARKFREDLYYRLCGIRIEIPPLRERLDDVPLLVAHFAKTLAKELGGAEKRVEPAALQALTRYRWPGNVRELENELRKAWHLAGDAITLQELSPDVRLAGSEPPPRRVADQPGEATLREVVDSVEREMIQDALERFGGNKSKIAEALGLSRVGLRKKMARLGLTDPRP